MDADINGITEQIIGCAFEVSNELGHGFLEKVYENALRYELVTRGLEVEQQSAVEVTYKQKVIGHYVADLIVNGAVIVELKTVKSIDDIHLAQCLNYLKATGYKYALLLNFFKPRVEYRRVIYN